MEKAFLSHSSDDKAVVRKIKNLLQRIWTYFDEDCFRAGDDFRKAISSHLQSTTLFVFFVSHKSLQSSWCKFEIDEAYWQTIKRENIEVLVLGLEEIDIVKLPLWMQKTKFEIISSPFHALQIIKYCLFKNTRANYESYIGRERDTQTFFEAVSTNMEYFPQIICINGLSGIGRRTFIKDILRRRFSLDYTAEFLLGDGDGMVELYRKLLDYNCINLTKNKLQERNELFLNSSDDVQIREIANVLASFMKINVCPIIVDDTCMLYEDGSYKKEWKNLFEEFATNYTNCYLIIVNTRYPYITADMKQQVYVQRLNALTEDSCYSLFDSLLKRNKVPIGKKEQVKEIAKYLEGYPPAILNAVLECKNLGIDVVCNDKTYLIDFQAHTFSKYLSSLCMDSLDNRLLTAIYNFESVTVEILSILIDIKQNVIAQSLRKMVNYNIVELNMDMGTYFIAPPMRAAIGRKSALYSKEEFTKFAKKLIDKFDGNKVADFNFIDNVIFAILRSDNEDDLTKFKDYLLPSHLLKRGKDANRNRDWKAAEKYARKALELNDELVDAKILLFMVLVRQEMKYNYARSNDEENTLLDMLKNNKIYYYLTGFRLWKRGRFEEAIVQYRKAIKENDESISTYRELAECYYQIGDIENAKYALKNVMDKRKINNPYILDLAVKIAIYNGDFQEAQELLEKLALTDREENVMHRRASYYLKRGELEVALNFANQACEGKHSLPEMYFLRMHICNQLGDFDQVQDDYNNIPKIFKHFNVDMLDILYTYMLLERDGWKAAESNLNRLKDGRKNIYIPLRKKILRNKLDDSRLSPLDEKITRAELKDIEAKEIVDVVEQL